MQPLKILAVSGSLRQKSFNRALLSNAEKLSSDRFRIELAASLDRLPFFNADKDKENVPNEVKAWRDELRSADAVLIACPEYAFAIPGVLKNALDWIVSSAELYGKPVGLINASPGYGGALSVQEALVRLLGVLTAKLDPKATLSIASVNKKINSDGNIIDPETEKKLAECVTSLVEMAEEARKSYLLG